MMHEDELKKRFTEEIVGLEESGAALPFIFSPSEAFSRLSLLQLVLRHPGVDSNAPGAGKFAVELARNIQIRLCKSPAMAEVARRGWERVRYRGEERED